MYCWQPLLRGVETPDGTSAVKQKQGGVFETPWAVPVPAEERILPTAFPLSSEKKLCIAVALSAVLLHKRQDTMFFQKLIDKKSALCRPTSMRFRKRITVFIGDGICLALDISFVGILLV